MADRRIIAVLLALGLLILAQGAPMAFGKTLTLLSEFEGRLVTEGDQPAAGVRLTRHWKWAWTGDEGEDETVTGPDGRFRFPEVTGRSTMAGIVPHTPSITQEIKAHGPAGSVEIWYADKRNYKPDGELGRPIRAVCHLDREPSADGLFWGTCEEDR